MDLKRVVAPTALNPIIGDLELDSTGDMVWTSDFVEQVAQSLQGKLAFFKGTWYLNKNEGIPYLDNLLGVKGVSETTWRVVLTQVLLSVPGIAVVDYVKPLITGREIELDFACRLATGQLFTSADNGPFRISLGPVENPSG
jgi:hypothetical protein